MLRWRRAACGVGAAGVRRGHARMLSSLGTGEVGEGGAGRERGAGVGAPRGPAPLPAGHRCAHPAARAAEPLPVRGTGPSERAGSLSAAGDPRAGGSAGFWGGSAAASRGHRCHPVQREHPLPPARVQSGDSSAEPPQRAPPRWHCRRHPLPCQLLCFARTSAAQNSPRRQRASGRAAVPGLLAALAVAAGRVPPWRGPW